MKFTSEDIRNLEKRRRVLFINSLSGFKSANLVGTSNAEGQTNLAIVSSVVHLGADPALMGMVMRPNSVPRGTLENILETGVYTLNHVSEEIFKKAHQTSARYPNDVSEFDAVGLTEYWEQGFSAPFVQESRIKIGMQFRERHTLDINGTEFIIGEIASVEIPDETLGEDGFVSLRQAGTVTVSSLDTYHSTQVLGSLSYAKPDKPSELLGRKHVDAPSIVDTNAAGKMPECVLVVAASGGIGQAYCQKILLRYPGVTLIRMARDLEKLQKLDGDVKDIQLDLASDESIASAIAELPADTNIDWMFIASGWLHDENTGPEKTFRRLSREHLLHSYNVNTVGPSLFVSALLVAIGKSKHAKSNPLKIGVLSARVGSVSDNQLGGWHSYRSSKSALHMMIKNIAIECKNRRMPVVIVGLQPGTTDTALSAPFQRGLSDGQLQTPEFTASHLITVMNCLEKQDSGKLFDYAGFEFQP